MAISIVTGKFTAPIRPAFFIACLALAFLPHSGRAQPIAMKVRTLYGGLPWGWIAVADDAGNFYSGDSRTQSIIRYRLDGEPTAIAGDGYVGLRDGPAEQARFRKPFYMARDPTGNLFIVDTDNFAIRKLTPDGQVSTLAGGELRPSTDAPPDGQGAAAGFEFINGIAIDEASNLYVSETYALRQITPDGRVTTWLRSPPDPRNGSTTFGPRGVAVNTTGNVLTYDSSRNAIIAVTASGTTKIVAPLDQKNPVTATVSIVTGINCDRDGYLYLTAVVSDKIGWWSYRFNPGGDVQAVGEGTVFLDAAKRAYLLSFRGLKRLNPAGADEILFSGAGEAGFRDGDSSTAKFNAPSGIVRDGSGQLFVTDSGNHAIRKIGLDGYVTTLAGGSAGFADGHGSNARFQYPAALAFDTDGQLLVVDRGNAVIRKVSLDGEVTTLAGTPGVTGTRLGSWSEVQFNSPSGIAVDQQGIIYVADSQNSRIVQLNAGQAAALPATFGRWYGVSSLALSPNGDLYVSDLNQIYAVAQAAAPGITRAVRLIAGDGFAEGMADGNGEHAGFAHPVGMAFDQRGYTYVADAYGYSLRRISPTRDVITVAGDGHVGAADGRGWDAQPGSVWGITEDGNNGLYLTDTLYNSIRQATWDLSTGPHILTQPADQSPGLGADARFFVHYDNGYEPHLRWQRKTPGTDTWVNIDNDPVFSGADTALLKIHAASLALDGDLFRCVISEGNASATSAAAFLHVNDEPVPPTIFSQPISARVGQGSDYNVTVGADPAPNYPAVTYQWLLNGAPLSGTNSPSFTVGNMDPGKSGLYSVIATSVGRAASHPAVVGLWTDLKLSGAGREVLANASHPNGNIYDQVLMTGPAVAVQADPGQVTRTSFVDLNGDIVQVELSGPGVLSIVLDGASGPAASDLYNQPDVQYMKGHAGIVVVGSNEQTNLSIFSVGKSNAVNQDLFRTNVAYDGVADIAFVAIFSSYSKFGGLRAANVHFWATRGYAGIYAPITKFNGPIYLGNIAAEDEATPTLVIGSASEVRIAGGDLQQPNGRAVMADGFSQLRFTSGTDSHGRAMPQQINQARFERDGADVTDKISFVSSQ